jgi:DNA-binding response OmpR family regulator
MGISLQANGQLIPVLDAHALVEQLLFSSQQETEAIAPPIPEPQEETDPLSQTILIVDDAALVRRRLEASLSTYGYVTQCCSDGREAWNWLQEHPHHLRLIITDIEMPNMDGFTLIDRCRQRGITAPILVISSRLSEDWSNEAKRLGANDYLTKGFSTVELINKVNSLLR